MAIVEIFYNKIYDWLEKDDLLYIDVFMQNGISFNFLKPNTGSTLNLELHEDYIKAYGAVSDKNDIDVIIPFEQVSHLTASFGEEQTEEASAEGE